MSVKRKVLGNWRQWNRPLLMGVTFVLAIVPATVVALSVVPHYVGPGPLQYAAMAAAMALVLVAALTVAAIID